MMYKTVPHLFEEFDDCQCVEEDRKRALEVGMDGYIAKPIHMESVLDALQEGLAGKH